MFPYKPDIFQAYFNEPMQFLANYKIIKICPKSMVSKACSECLCIILFEHNMAGTFFMILKIIIKNKKYVLLADLI